MRVYDEAGNVIETHEHKGDFKELVRFLAPAGAVAEFIWFADAKSYPRPFTLCGSCFFSCVPVATGKSGNPASSYNCAVRHAVPARGRFPWPFPARTWGWPSWREFFWQGAVIRSNPRALRSWSSGFVAFILALVQ